MKSEVYSWRVSSELKSTLEKEARRRKMPLSSVLDLAAREWLKSSRWSEDEAEQQSRLHQAAARCLGAFSGRDPHRSENASASVRQRLRRNHSD